MRMVWKMSLVMGIALLMVGPTLAQGGKGTKGGGFPFGGGFGGPFGGMGQDPAALLNNQQIAKELKLTAEQKQKIPDAVMKALKEVLEPEQVERLKQIQMQMRGAAALKDAKVQKALKLTAQQKDDLNTLFSDSEKETKELMEEAKAGGDRLATFKKMGALRKETDEKALGVLNASQKKAWKEMTGPEFKMQRPGGFGPPGGAGGGAIRLDRQPSIRPDDGTLPQVPNKGRKDA